MQTFLLLALLLATAISLVGAALFLYRYLTRSRLFPQLPRIWSSDRQRSIMLGGVGLLFLAVFLVYSGLTRTPAPPEAPVAVSPPPAPSFDGQPPPQLTPANAVLASQSPPSPPAEAPETALPGPLPGGELAPARPPAPSSSLAAPAPPAAASSAAQPLPAPAAPNVPPPAPSAPAVPVPTPPPTPAAQAAPPPSPAPPSPAPVAPPAPLAAPPAPPTHPPTPVAPPAAVTPAPAATPSTPPPPPAPPSAPEKPYWVVVAESHQQKASAEAARAKYAKLDQPVQVVEVDLAKKGRWFRVCLGRFTDHAQAQAMTREWKKQGVSPDPFVARMP